MSQLNPFFGQFGGQFVPEALVPALKSSKRLFVRLKMIQHLKPNFMNS